MGHACCLCSGCLFFVIAGCCRKKCIFLAQNVKKFNVEGCSGSRPKTLLLASSPKIKFFSFVQILYWRWQSCLLWGVKTKLTKRRIFDIIKPTKKNYPFKKQKDTILQKMLLCVSLCCLMLRLDRGDIGAYGREEAGYYSWYWHWCHINIDIQILIIKKYSSHLLLVYLLGLICHRIWKRWILSIGTHRCGYMDTIYGNLRAKEYKKKLVLGKNSGLLHTVFRQVSLAPIHVSP